MAEALPNYPAFEKREGPLLSTSWEDWIEGLDSMFAAMKITDDTEKFIKLYHYLGQTRKVLKKLEANGVDAQDYPAAKTALNKHYNPQRNSIYLLNQLYHMQQNAGESMDHFYMRVKEQIQAINLQSKTAAQIEELLTLAQLVNSTNDSNLRTKALRDSNLKLKTFLDNARAHEMANRQSMEIKGTSDSLAVRKKAFPKQNRKSDQYQDNGKKTMADCHPHVSIVVEISTLVQSVVPRMLHVTSVRKKDTFLQFVARN